MEKERGSNRRKLDGGATSRRRIETCVCVCVCVVEDVAGPEEA